MKPVAATVASANTGASLPEAPIAIRASGAPGLLTVPQAAAQLTVSRRTLERLIASGEFPSPLKIGRSSRVHPEDVSAFLEKLRRKRGDKIGAS